MLRLVLSSTLVFLVFLAELAAVAPACQLQVGPVVDWGPGDPAGFADQQPFGP